LIRLLQFSNPNYNKEETITEQNLSRIKRRRRSFHAFQFD